MTIELATERDLDALADIHRESFTSAWTREMFAQELRQPALSRVHVLRLPDGTVAGFCVSWTVADELHINALAVRAAHRRRGLATMLLRAVLRDAASRGAARATLDVRASNVAALALYRRLGFDIAATRRDYYTNPVESALILWRGQLERVMDEEERP